MLEKRNCIGHDVNDDTRDGDSDVGTGNTGAVAGSVMSVIVRGACDRVAEQRLVELRDVEAITLLGLGAQPVDLEPADHVRQRLRGVSDVAVDLALDQRRIER
jgi:hypothetical protein